MSDEMKACREVFERIAPKHNIDITKFKHHPDKYKFEWGNAMWRFAQDIWQAAWNTRPSAGPDEGLAEHGVVATSRDPTDARIVLVHTKTREHADAFPQLLCDALNALRRPQPSAWRAIADAKKDRTIIWARFHDDLYPRITPERPDLEIWNGRHVPLLHPGLVTNDDGSIFDMGWNIAAPVGCGGFPDKWIAGWLPLPARE